MPGKISNKWTVKKVPKQIQRYETQSLFIKTPFKQKHESLKLNVKLP